MTGLLGAQGLKNFKIAQENQVVMAERATAILLSHVISINENHKAISML
ncbi:hypothetical protein [Mesorhizobium sp. B2-3-13]|nr:hypothetical protein [Mesorhizobium sp. B2-3-13]